MAHAQSVSAPRSSARDQLYQEFQTATEGKRFLKYPADVLRTVMHDRRAGPTHRVRAWIELHAWGNYALYAVREDGAAATQHDCAQELAIGKASVSRAVHSLASLGYLRMEGRKLYPERRPELREIEADHAFTEFKQSWEAENPEIAAEAERLKARLREIRQMQLRAFRERGDAYLARISEESKTAGGDLLSPNPIPNNARASVDEASDKKAPARATESKRKLQDTQLLNSQPGDAYLARISQELHMDLPAAKELLARCELASPGITAEAIIQLGREKIARSGRVRNITGLLIQMVPEMAKLNRRPSSKLQNAQLLNDREEQRRIAQAALEDPDISDAERDLAREILNSS